MGGWARNQPYKCNFDVGVTDAKASMNITRISPHMTDFDPGIETNNHRNNHCGSHTLCYTGMAGWCPGGLTKKLVDILNGL